MERFPFTPFPDGVFAVADSKEITYKKTKTLIFMGKTVTLTRNAKGTLVHSYKKFAAFEKYGFIFLTHNPLNVLPRIVFPEWNLEEWGDPIEHYFKIRSHPQEILENSVDQFHFYSVHHYADVNIMEPFQMNGPLFTIHYQLKRSRGLLGWFDRSELTLQLAIQAYGLGLSVVDIWLPRYQLFAKQMVFPTPIDGNHIAIRALTSIKIPQKLPNKLPFWIKKAIANQLSRMAGRGFLMDFIPDIRIWENKRYVSDSFGIFQQYRAWAKQFYRQ